MRSVRELVAEIKPKGGVAFDEPMYRHTSFGLGGPADLFLVPADESDLARAWLSLESDGIPTFLLGGGTNLLVADRGIRGAVIDLSGMRGIEVDGCTVSAQAGTPMDEVVERALAAGLSGLEFAASLPGTAGGAAWMNARCYEAEVSDVLERVESLSRDGARRSHAVDPAAWGYKRSPFQQNREAILRVHFRLHPGSRPEIEARMLEHRADRERKGHFRFPCAGSIFKNDRSLGAPTGRIIDEMGLKGLRIGGAQVAPFHGNIIVNLGNASAADVRALVEQVEDEARRQRGIALEREVILVGDW